MTIKNQIQAINKGHLSLNIKVPNRESRIENLSSSRGFTLVEIVVAVTIFAIVALTLGATFISGARIWQRAKDFSFLKHEALLSLEAISKELSRCINTPLVGFEATERRITFASLKNESVVAITYTYKPLQNSLWRKELELRDILNKKKNITEKKVLPLESFDLEFYYFDEGEDTYLWKNSWSEEDGIPKAVKLKMKTKDEVFKKTIFIPVS